MGSSLSSVKGIYKALGALINVLRGLNEQYKGLQSRVFAEPGLPSQSPTSSYWLDDPPFPELVNIQSRELPSQADVLIIGSGITGAAVSRSILSTLPKTRVVVLEARQLCSGATGRNGGHIKASPHEIFPRWRRTVGPEKAAALVRFQMEALGAMTKLCEEERIEIAECRRVETVDLFLDSAAMERAVREAENLREWVPEFEIGVWDAAAAREKFGVNEQVKGAVSYPAGALWPYRFVTSIWKSLVGTYSSLSIETSTAVTSISVTSSSSYPYRVVTNRGTILARHVVHANNAFATQFVPGLKGKMTGFLAHVSAQRPGRGMADLDGKRSWSIMYGERFDYVTQRPSESGQPGDILLGGGFSRSEKQGLEYIGFFDDSKLDTLTAAHLLGIFPTIFEPKWGGDGGDGGESASKPRMVWSGVDGITGDMLPFVGRLDERLTRRKIRVKAETMEFTTPGEWISAAYCGDGMVWAWLCGTALGKMILGEKVDGFPEELLPTYERVKRVDLMDLLNDVV